MIIEEYYLSYLMNALGKPCYLEMPEVMDDEFIIIERLGSYKSNMIESTSLAFQSYSDTMHGAIVLNEAAKAAVKNSIERPEIIKLTFSSDYNHTDPHLKKYRYQAVYDIAHY